jgi:hypothetical protein
VCEDGRFSLYSQSVTILTKPHLSFQLCSSVHNILHFPFEHAIQAVKQNSSGVEKSAPVHSAAQFGFGFG